MKTIVAIFLVMMIASYSNAADPRRIGFKAYSSGSAKTCAVFGMKHSLSGGFQGFAPYSSYSRTLSLGTKGYANYSTLNTGAIKFTCRIGTTNVTEPVKVQIGGFLNGVETHFLTLDRDVLITQ